MPALPEIEVLRRDLDREVVGRRIKEAEVRPGSPAMKIIKRHGRRKEFQDLLAGARIDRVRRSGVYLELELDNDRSFVVGLGPSGRLVKTSVSEAIVPHTHLVISFTIGGQLRLIDPRHAGEAFSWPTGELKQLAELTDFAVDPFESPLTWQHFSYLLQERHEILKKALADPRFIVGLGDLYADEVLFTAGLRHDHASNHLSAQDVRRLYRSLMETLNGALKARGTSLQGDGFVDLDGRPGAFQLELKVFEREGQPCRRCRHPIVREKIDGTYSYFCPQCQS